MPGLSGEIANLIVSLRLDDSGFSGKLNNVARSLNRMDAGLSQMGRGAGQVGSGLARLGTVAAAAAAGGLAAVVTTAASMEEAFIGVQKTVDETANFSFEQLRDVLRQMSSDTGTAFEELSRIGEIGGALGVPIESLDEFIDVVNRLGVATDLSVDDAATALGHLGTVLQLSGEDFRDLADGLVALGNAGASSEGQIVAIAERFAVAGKRAGLTTSEILALASATASMGIEVEAGGTALSNTFNQIAVAIGTGGKEVTAFTDLLGISAKEFRRRWETDALGTFQEFLREVDKLPAIEQAVAFEAAGITGARQQAAVGALADGYLELGRQLEVVEDREGALKEESDKFYASSANAFRRLRENVRIAAAVIGDELLPVTNELITDFVQFLAKDSTQAGIAQFAKDLAAGVRGLVSELKGTDFSGLIGGMKLAAEVASGAFNAFKALPAPIQQLAIAALIANKVTGGAVGQIAKGLANIVFGALKIMTVQAGVVNINAAVVNGGIPGVGGAAGKGFGLADAIKFAIPAVALALAQKPARDLLAENNPFDPGNKLNEFLGERSVLAAALDRNTDAITSWTPLGQFDRTNMGGTRKPIAGGGKAGVRSLPDTAFDSGGGVVKLPNTAMSALTNTSQNTARLPSILNRQESAVRTLAAQVSAQRAATERGFANQSGYLNRQSGYLSTIAAKNFSPRISVKVNSSVSITDITRRLVSARVATGTISEF